MSLINTSPYIGAGVSVPQIAADPYWANVALLMHMEDSSVKDEAGHLVTNSAVTINTAAPKTDAGSASFAGTNTSYLTTPNSAEYDLAARDFTIEFWFNLTSIPDGAFCIVGKWPLSFLCYGLATGMTFYINGATAILNGGPTWTTGLWYHVAITRSGSNWTLWVNGSSVATANSAVFINAGANALIIGKNGDNNRNYFHGLLDELRITGDVARYTATFTPPTVAFSDYGEDPYLNDVVALLLFDNTTADVKQHTMTNTAGAVISTNAAKSGSTSLYCPTGSDYAAIGAASDLTFPGDVTIEAWLYCSSLPSTYGEVVGNYTTNNSENWAVEVGSNGSVSWYPSGGTATNQITAPAGSVVAGRWNHIAAVRWNNNTYIYVNGIRSTSTKTLSGTLGSTTKPIAIGGRSVAPGTSAFYIDSVRITKVARYTTASFNPGNARYPSAASADTHFASVTLLMPMDSNIQDIKGNTITNSGSVSITTATKKMGVGSARFNGTQYLDIAANAGLDFAGDPFTIEGWFYVDNVTGTKPIFSFANRAMLFQIQNTVPVFYINSVASGWAGNAGAVAAATWTHFALVRNAADVCTFYLNGVAVGQVPTHSENVGSSSVGASLGRDLVGGTFLLGYLDDFRITKGIARYSANFPPPALPYQTA